MNNFLKQLLSEKKKVILGLIAILLIFSTVYQLKFIGIAADEDSEVVKITEVSEANELENTSEVILDEDTQSDLDSVEEIVLDDLVSDEVQAAEEIIEIQETDITDDTKVKDNVLEQDSQEITEDFDIIDEEIIESEEIQNDILQEEIALVSENEFESIDEDIYSAYKMLWQIDSDLLATVRIHNVDSKGVELQGDTTQISNVSLNDIINLNSFIETINNYIYEDAHLASYNGENITSIGFEKNDTQNYIVKLYSGSQNISSFEISNKTVSIDLYLVYYKIGTLTIEDDIKDNGVLRAILKDSDENELSIENNNFKLVWYRCDTENGEYLKDERALIGNSSDVYNISDDGTEINVALDKGARKYYKVELVNSEQTVVASSSAVQVEYFDDVQNGGFESPVLQSSYTGTIAQLSQDTSGMVWKTTAEDGNIELARNGILNNNNLKRAYKNGDGAAEGKQFAELNCESTGALYQDVLTAPGEVLNWSLYHRGREGKDTMYVVAMATNYFESITSYTELQAMIQNIIANPSDYPDAYCVTITDDNKAWKQYSGSFVVPENQYLTRFFFVAGETANGIDTTGNLIDDIVLSQDIIKTEPESGKSTITIKKIIQNVPYSVKSVQKSSIDISLYDSKNTILNQNDTTFTTFAYDQTSQNWFAMKTITLDNSNIILINAKESNYSQIFENYNFSDSTYTLVDNTEDSLIGGNLKDDIISNLELISKHNYTLTIYNNYKENYTSLTINKVDIHGLSLLGSTFKIYEAQNESKAVVVNDSDDVNNGKLIFSNLKYDTEYIIEEVTAPNKYYLLETPIHITINYSNGVQILNYDDFNGYVTKTANTTNELNVVNIRYVEMPKAGGVGIYKIYTLGILIMIGTAVIYTKSKRK